MEQTREVRALDQVADLLTENHELRAEIARLRKAIEKLVGTDQFGFYEGAIDTSRDQDGVWINADDFNNWLQEGRAACRLAEEG